MKLFSYNIFRCSLREVVIHDAGRNVATTRVDRAPLGLEVGSRARLVGSRVSGLSPPFCSPKRTDGERPVIKGMDGDLAHNLSHRRLLGILSIYRCPMYVSWEGAG
ncbi:MAG: hypothetical protein QOJ20_1959 [Mycobacterium sp.]|nr:hypothetical protein [Mycobacterium sp.]